MTTLLAAFELEDTIECSDCGKQTNVYAVMTAAPDTPICPDCGLHRLAHKTLAEVLAPYSVTLL